MSQARQLREFELIRLMLTDRQALRCAYVQLFDDAPDLISDRDLVYVILDREFPSEYPAERPLEYPAESN